MFGKKILYKYLRISWLAALGTAPCVSLSMAHQQANPATEKLLALSENTSPGDMGGVRGLLTEEPDVNSEDESDCTALLKASENGHMETVKLLLEANADVNCQRGGVFTPLMIASQNGHTKIVELLLGAGAKANTGNYGGATALLMASWNGHTDIVRMLLNANAKVNVATDGPEFISRYYDRPSRYEHNKLKTTAQSSPLILASHNGYTEIVKLLLEAGADVNHKSFDGATALILASRNGHTEVVKLLLEAGANVNATLSTARNYYSRIRPNVADIMSLPARERNLHEYLKKMGESTPLILASQNGHTEIVKLLLEADAKVNVATSNDATALILAMQNGHKEIARLLKEYGAKE